MGDGCPKAVPASVFLAGNGHFRRRHAVQGARHHRTGYLCRCRCLRLFQAGDAKVMDGQVDGWWMDWGGWIDGCLMNGWMAGRCVWLGEWQVNVRNSTRSDWSGCRQCFVALTPWLYWLGRGRVNQLWTLAQLPFQQHSARSLGFSPMFCCFLTFTALTA